MSNLKQFETLYDVVMHLLTEAEGETFNEYNTQKWIQGLRFNMAKDPATTYFGTILQDMKITVINDWMPRKVDYTDPDPNAYRDPEFIRIYCGGGYNPQQWTHMPTMAVDPARNLYIGEQYIQSLGEEFPTTKELNDVIKAILLHESMHISELTFFRGQGKDGQAWNIATDAYINMFIIKSGRKLPKGCIIPDKDGFIELKVAKHAGDKHPTVYRYQIEGKTAEILYKELMALFDPEKEKKPGGPPPPPQPLQKGDPVYHTNTKTYGVVLDPTKDPIEIRVITKEEAMQRAKAKNSGIQSI